MSILLFAVVTPLTSFILPQIPLCVSSGNNRLSISEHNPHGSPRRHRTAYPALALWTFGGAVDQQLTRHAPVHVVDTRRVSAPVCAVVLAVGDGPGYAGVTLEGVDGVQSNLPCFSSGGIGSANTILYPFSIIFGMIIAAACIDMLAAGTGHSGTSGPIR